MLINPIGTQIALTQDTANNIRESKYVYLANTGSADATITEKNSGGTTQSSFTLLAGQSIFVVKSFHTNTIEASTGDVVATACGRPG